VISGPEGLMVVDPGSLGAARAAVELIRSRLGGSPTAVRYLAATHFHIDHIGGMGPLLTACGPETRVIFSAPVRDYLAGRQRLNLLHGWFSALVPVARASAAYVRRLADILPANPAGIPLPGLRRLTGLPFAGERCLFVGAGKGPPGFADWEIMSTPGHTEDSISLYSPETGELICGDLLHNMPGTGGRGTLNAFCRDRNVILTTLEALRRTIAPRVIYPGHGEAIRGEKNALREVKVC
jgi:glyoxylase-like metal-dependent hydrolase (beta-lactamase superfamily II)